MKKGYKGLSLKKENHLSNNGEYRLFSPSQKFIWSPGENTAIFCGDIEDSSGGFYALKINSSELTGYGNRGLICELLMFGKVIEGEEGFKSEKAMINLIFIPTIKPIPLEALYKLSDYYHAPLMKAEGRLYDAICYLRRENLLKEGKLPLIQSQRNYRKQWSWMEDTEHRKVADIRRW